MSQARNLRSKRTIIFDPAAFAPAPAAAVAIMPVAAPVSAALEKPGYAPSVAWVSQEQVAFARALVSLVLAAWYLRVAGLLCRGPPVV